MTSILRAPVPATGTPRRYAPKGSRPLRLVPKPAASALPHGFLARVTDPVSCFWCNLPRANGRHA